MSVLLNRVESSDDGRNVVKRWFTDLTEEPSVICLPVVHRPPLSRAHGVHVIGDERGRAHRIRGYGGRTREHTGNVASVGGFGASAQISKQSILVQRQILS